VYESVEFCSRLPEPSCSLRHRGGRDQVGLKDAEDSKTPLTQCIEPGHSAALPQWFYMERLRLRSLPSDEAERGGRTQRVADRLALRAVEPGVHLAELVLGEAYELVRLLDADLLTERADLAPSPVESQSMGP
jgi:hypothetical protein